MDLAEYVGLKDEKRNFLIPVYYKYCNDLPSMLKLRWSLDYRKRRFVNFYAKLFECFNLKDVDPELLKYPDEEENLSASKIAPPSAVANGN